MAREPLHASPFIDLDEETERFRHSRAFQLAAPLAIGIMSLVAMVS